MGSRNIILRVVDFGLPEYFATVELRRRILRWPLGLDFTPEELAAEQRDFHVAAMNDDDAIGCLVLTPQNKTTVKMRQVAVEPEWQGKGYGKHLVEYSEQVARAEGFTTMVLHARENVVPFYLKLGYFLEGEPFEEVTIPHRKMVKSL